MDPRQVVDDLLELAMANPVVAYEQGTALYEEIAAADHVNRSRALRALGIAARLASSIPVSLRHGEDAVREARLAGNEILEAEALMSLAGTRALSGDYQSALTALELAEGKSEGLLAAEIKYQRGAVLARMGGYEDAHQLYLEVLPVFVSHRDANSEALTRQNLGMVNIVSGRLDDAETELLRARGLFEELGMEMPLAAVDHALGVVASYRGDLVGALRLLDESERRYAELVDAVAEIQVSRCEVLLSAGLISESARLADSIAETLAGLGLGEEEAEARLVAAQATLAAGRPRDAISRAKAAGELFYKQGRGNRRLHAEHVEIAALLALEEVTEPLMERARAVAEELEREGTGVAASGARLTAASIAIALGRRDEAATDLVKVAESKTGPVESRLQSWRAEAMLYDIRGDRRRAMAAARSGMELLDRYQAALGASDIRAGIEMHARRLGDLGLRLAVETGDGRTAFQWMERSRARTLRSRPVSPPADDEMLSQLADLRQVTSKMRGASGSEAVDLRKWERSLQEAIRRRTRMTPGAGRPIDLGDIAVKVKQLLETATLIEFGSVGDRIFAVVVREGEFELRQTGSIREAARELESLRFMLRRLARRGDHGRESHVTVAALLDELLFGDVETGEGPLVVVPIPELYATPWSMLPRIGHRPLTVAPSAELWLRRSDVHLGADNVVVAGGPGLEQAEEEVRAVAGLYDSARVWSPKESKVDEVLEAMDGADVAHVASHAFFQFENPMFSSLRLGDGDLFVYDMERLRKPPRLVVLSACDSGFSESRAGEELLGLSASLLAMGTGTVVASIGLVPDSDATRELMVEFHRGLLQGVDPARALRRAQHQVIDHPGGLVAAASFICIGRG